MGRYPNLFIIGSPRCGTTKLFSLLSSHPSFFCPKVKEPKFFSPNYSIKSMTERDYLALYKTSTALYRVDASTSYVHDYAALRKISTTVRNPKLIWIQRNPSDAEKSLRSVHQANYNNLDLATLIDENPRFNYRHIYDFERHLENILKYFSRDDLLILSLHDLESWAHKIEGFLGVESIKLDGSVINQKAEWRSGLAKRLFIVINKLILRLPLKPRIGLMTKLKKYLSK